MTPWRLEREINPEELSVVFDKAKMVAQAYRQSGYDPELVQLSNPSWSILSTNNKLVVAFPEHAIVLKDYHPYPDLAQAIRQDYATVQQLLIIRPDLEIPKIVTPLKSEIIEGVLFFPYLSSAIKVSSGLKAVEPRRRLQIALIEEKVMTHLRLADGFDILITPSGDYCLDIFYDSPFGYLDKKKIEQSFANMSEPD